MSVNKKTTLHQQLTDNKQSAFKRYQAMVMGNKSIWYLIKCELITLLSCSLPGALGVVLRKKLYPLILASVGKNVIFGRNITIRHGLKIQIGDNCIIDDNVSLDAKGIDNQGLFIGHDTIISKNTILSCKNGNIRIGNNCAIGINNLIHALENSDVNIGNDVLVGAFSYFIGNGPYVTDELDTPFKQQGMTSKGGIKIENNVWFGSHIQVLDGVTIGKSSIIGAASMVNKSIDEQSVYAGTPARKISQRQAKNSEPKNNDSINPAVN